MNLSIRDWLAENNIEISQIKEYSQGQITGVTLRMIRDMEFRIPSPFDICTLAEVLELPLGSVWHEVGVFARLTQSVVSFLGRDKPFNRNEASWLAFQVAYLRALEEVLIEEESLSRVWLARCLVDVSEEGRREQGKKSCFWGSFTAKPLRDEHLQALIHHLRKEKLNDVQAKEALLRISNSSFVETISHIAVAWLVTNSVSKTEAELIIQRLKNKLLGHLIVVVSENAATLVQLQKFFRLGNSIEFRSTEFSQKSNDGIDLNKENYRASLIKKIGKPLLIESFSLKDIYISPTGLLLRQNHQPVDLMKWVISQLDDLETITVIESESGYGKTSFCYMLASRIAQKLYPEWIPVLISLSKIKYGDNLQETLESAFRDNPGVSLSAWLKEPNHNYLLILDGLNELPHSGANKKAIAFFMQQLFEFQLRFRHKVILTSQSWALEDIGSKAALNLRRIQIQPWGQDEWKQWFSSWAKVQSMAVAQSFFKFLKKNKAFSQKSHFLLADLIRQPLMLYLLAVLHRDELIDDDILQSATNPQITNTAVVLWKIYEHLNQWLLGYPARSISQKILISSASTHIHRTSEAVNSLIKKCPPQELIHEMQSVAIKILHSGKISINLEADFNQLPKFYFSQERNREKGEQLTHSLIPTTNIKLSHLKFGEYLCAASIVNQLKALTKTTLSPYGEMIFVVDSPVSIAENIYYLLGYGILTPEIEELVIEGLRQEHKNKFSFELLCRRLEPFWYAYCAGRWLDEGIAHKAFTYLKQLQNPINVEQINAAVGINIFLLLSACYRQTKQTFSPCGNQSSLREFHPQALTKLIAKTSTFHQSATKQRIGQKALTFLNLSKADLTQAMLAGVNLANTDLSSVQLKNACLAGANLADANLTGADLTSVNLTNANLTNAKLTGANLTGANLSGVNLDLVNLSNACLFQAIIADSQKETALANGAVFSLDKFEELKRLLSYQSQADDIDTGEKTEIAFNLQESAGGNNNPLIGEIESAEGEPIVPLDLHHEIEDETIMGRHLTDF